MVKAVRISDIRKGPPSLMTLVHFYNNGSHCPLGIESGRESIRNMVKTYLSQYWEDQRDPFVSKNRKWQEPGHQMVLTKRNGNRPSALCSRMHGMQSFPSIQRLIDSQRASVSRRDLALQCQLVRKKFIPHKYIFCDLPLEGLREAILSTCRILAQPSRFRLCGAKQRLVFH